MYPIRKSDHFEQRIAERHFPRYLAERTIRYATQYGDGIYNCQGWKVVIRDYTATTVLPKEAATGDARLIEYNVP
jgi:hypothetical protein